MNMIFGFEQGISRFGLHRCGACCALRLSQRSKRVCATCRKNCTWGRGDRPGICVCCWQTSATGSAHNDEQRERTPYTLCTVVLSLTLVLSNSQSSAMCNGRTTLSGLVCSSLRGRASPSQECGKNVDIFWPLKLLPVTNNRNANTQHFQDAHLLFQDAHLLRIPMNLGCFKG